LTLIRRNSNRLRRCLVATPSRFKALRAEGGRNLPATGCRAAMCGARARQKLPAGAIHA
jgi:hypothetical protein